MVKMAQRFLMNIETITVGICMVLYFITGATFAAKGNLPWALVWFAYAVANVGLIWASKK